MTNESSEISRRWNSQSWCRFEKHGQDQNNPLQKVVVDRPDPIVFNVLDVKTDLLTDLVVGKQGKSLEVILLDPDFRSYPVLNPLVTL